MSIATDSSNSAATGVADAVLGPQWPITKHSSDTTLGALTLFGGSEYVSVGRMTGERGNTLTVYMDRWGGSAANYIVAPEVVFAGPDNWGENVNGTFQQSFNQAGGGGGIPCTNNCGGRVPDSPGTSLPTCLINCGGGTGIEIETVPEPATAWLIGICVVLLLLYQQVHRLAALMQARASNLIFGLK